MNRDELIARIKAGEKFEYLMFLRGPLSQWIQSSFALDGLIYPTAEHWMMAEKARLFGDAGALNAIMITRRPSEAKLIGRQVRDYNDDDWAMIRYQAVVRGNLAKFAQNPPLLTELLATGKKVLVEANPEDAIWGVGLEESDPRCHDPRQWKGQNLLGFALMDVRGQLDIGDKEAICFRCGGRVVNSETPFIETFLCSCQESGPITSW